MKKRFYLLGMLAAGLTFAGCTDDIDDATGSGGNATVGDGYVKVAINLPTTSGNSTRSANDDFNDGEDFEYEVKNGLIAFFQGVDEVNAHFVKAYDLGTEFSDWDSSTGNNNVTTSKDVTLNEVPMPEAGMNTYALVVLNNNGLITLGENGSLKVNETQLTTSSTLHNSGLLTAIATTASKMTEHGFFMTNAPISTGPSQMQEWDVTVTTLAPVDVSKTEPETADPIYVERSVAKVEVSVDDKIIEGEKGESVKVRVYETGTSSVKPNNYVTFCGWKLNITNKSTKLVRDVIGNNPYQPAARYWASLFNDKAIGKENRFFGLIGGPYRTYWAIDGNYNNAEESDEYQTANFNNIKDEQDISWNVMYNDGQTKKEYCLENTMVAADMMQGVTTGVILEGFYTVEDESYPNGDIFTLGTNDEIYGTTEMLNYITNILRLHGSDNVYVFDRDGTGDNNQDGSVIDTANEFANFFKTADGSAAMSEDDAEILMKDVRVGSINFYFAGRTYYWTKPIKHFGDYYTPLDGEYVENTSEYTENDHLGRYGVVRNNWYQIEIASVSNPGLPEIPELPVDPGDPDDPKEGFVKVNINILSWAKRQQNVDL